MVLHRFYDKFSGADRCICQTMYKEMLLHILML